MFHRSNQCINPSSDTVAKQTDIPLPPTTESIVGKTMRDVRATDAIALIQRSPKGQEEGPFMDTASRLHPYIKRYFTWTPQGIYSITMHETYVTWNALRRIGPALNRKRKVGIPVEDYEQIYADIQWYAEHPWTDAETLQSLVMLKSILLPENHPEVGMIRFAITWSIKDLEKSLTYGEMIKKQMALAAEIGIDTRQAYTRLEIALHALFPNTMVAQTIDDAWDTLEQRI